MSSLNKGNILLVEDQVIIGYREKMELEERNYLVDHVISGKEAIDAALGEDAKYDLILMDIDLGEGPNGIETAQRILEKKDIPILFLSSHTEPEIVEKTEGITSYGYVVKNSGITVLDASIKMAFKLHVARQNEQKARNMAEKHLKYTENTLEEVIENMLEGFLLTEVILNDKGEVYDIKYLRVNQTAEKITSTPKHKFLGRTAREVYNYVEPSFFRKHTEVYNTGKPIQFIERFSELNHWYELSVYKVDGNKLAIFFNNITDRIESEIALKASENKYRSLFDNMAQEVHFWKLIRDATGDIENWELVDANPAALRSWKKSRKEVIGKRTDEIFIESDPVKLFLPIVEKIFADNEPHSWEAYLQETDQHLFMTSAPFGEFFVTTGIDVTDNKLLKEQLKSKEILVKEVLHRIKNNFSSLISILKLQAETITEQAALDAIHESAARIESLRLIYEKLLLSENYQNLNVKNYVEELVRSIIQLSFDKKNIQVDVHIDDFIIEERKMLPIGAIINELLTNSMKHAFKTRDQGLINLKITKSGESVLLYYEDDGVGLPPGFDQDQSGLGLMLVSLFAQQLKGTYGLKNEKGVKCEIQFTL